MNLENPCQTCYPFKNEPPILETCLSTKWAGTLITCLEPFEKTRRMELVLTVFALL